MMFAKIGGIDLATFMLLSLPYSRKHEKEADVLGLDIMVPIFHVPRSIFHRFRAAWRTINPGWLAGWLLASAVMHEC